MSKRPRIETLLRRFRSSRRPATGPITLYRRRLLSEPLEDRRMLSVVTVNNNLDLVNGDTSSIANLIATDGGDGISLREALDAANNTAGADDVNFDVALAGSTITLGGTQLTISDDVTVTGLGASDLTIDAAGTSRAMIVTNNATADISGLTMTGGNMGRGGALRNNAGSTTTVTAVVIDGNTATVGSYDAGGGIWNSGNLTITDSTISNNSTTAGNGAGIWNGGVLSIARTTISGNSSALNSGGIYSYGGSITITDSTVSDNTAVNATGGVFAVAVTTLSITDSTISGNVASVAAGGVLVAYGSATISHSTIVDNTGGDGGGIHLLYSGSLTLDHTIVANNTAPTGPDIHGTVTANWSLIKDTSGATIGGANNVTGLDPILGPLANNGGPTQTHALLAGSPAIDAGDPAIVGAPANDQRGYPFVRQNGTIDIGAYEVQSLSLVVDTAVDESDGDYSPGDLSLREAIELANANPGADTINFDVALAGSTIGLTLGQLSISDDVTINGLGASDLTVDAQGASRVLSVGAGTTDTISGLTLTGGVGNGGGVYNSGDLTVTDSVITGNSASKGGGIFNVGVFSILRSTVSDNYAGQVAGGIYGAVGSGGVTITDSTVSGNSAVSGAGGVWSYYSSLTITGTTISGNTAGTYGGGVLAAYVTATITHSTIVDNSADRGGGIDTSYTGGATIEHTIVANNAATGGSGPDIQGPATANWSLIEDTSGATIGGANNITGVDPMLGPLANNGGPTQTYALLPGSPAIDAGDPAAVAGVGDVPLYDQRTAPFGRVVGTIDIGAYEAQSLSLVVDTNVDESDGDYSPGDLSLREALQLANANPGADTINFDGSMAGSTITLGGAQLAINDDVTINGLGASDLTIDAAGTSRVIVIGGGATVDISGLTLTGGHADRGAGLRVNNASTAILTAVVVQGNQSTTTSYDSGGGLWNANGSTLTLIDSTVAGNTAAGGGGGVWSNANLTISGTTISGNASNGSFGRGGGVVNNGGNLTITDSTISGNTANIRGGGIYNRMGNLTLTNSTLSGNSAIAADGGGIFSNTSGNYLTTVTTITGSTISGNTAALYGGGVFNLPRNPPALPGDWQHLIVP